MNRPGDQMNRVGFWLGEPMLDVRFSMIDMIDGCNKT
jgi:hypothetical protein